MENQKKHVQLSNGLLFFGILLFASGLFSGLFIPMMANPRMGLSAHLEGIMNGIFLVILGFLWNKLSLSHWWLRITYWLVLYGSFANFIAVLIAAITGAGRMMPIAGGQQGSAFEEGVISFLLVTLTLVMLIVCVIVLTGLYRSFFLKSNR